MKYLLNWRIHGYVFFVAMAMFVGAAAILTGSHETEKVGHMMEAFYPWYGAIHMIYIAILWVLFGGRSPESEG